MIRLPQSLVRLLTLCALLFAGPAMAQGVPDGFDVHGRILDAGGLPVDGITPVSFALYADAEGDGAVWMEAVELDLADGYYTHVLGAMNALDPEIFDGTALYLGVTVDGTDEMRPRFRIGAVPYAWRAAVAGDVRGDINPNTVSIDGEMVIDADGAWVGDPAGMRGEAGPPGAVGPMGPAGPQGDVGPGGADGAQGPAGADGAQGPAGADGAQGQRGARGPAGADGAQGPAGADGAQGPAGADGAQGPAGADGARGPAGADGAQGPAGADGAQGQRGQRGLQGIAGPVGADGAQGPVGADGAQGPIGADGARGQRGQRGVQGAVGPEGPAAAGSQLIDGNGVVLGSVLGLDSGFSQGATFVTATGHTLTVQWDGRVAGGQIYYSGANCTGTAWLNAGYVGAPAIYGKRVVFSRAFNSLMVPANVNANTGAAASEGFNAATIDNPNCGNGGANGGWRIRRANAADVGLPAYPIATPITIR